MDNEQLQIMAAKYQASLVRANANNKRYLATENGKAKSKDSQENGEREVCHQEIK